MEKGNLLLTETPASEIHAAEEMLGRFGVRRAHLERMRANNGAFAQKVADFIMTGGYEPPLDQEIARILMSQNFFGVNDWSVCFGQLIPKKELAKIAKFPWSEEVLESECPFNKGKKVRETHKGFLGLETFNGQPLTLMQWHRIFPASGQPRFYFDGERETWYKSEKFATETVCSFRWYLMLKEIVTGSESNSWDNQVAMLPPEYEVPLAVEEVAKNFLHYRKNGVYLNLRRYARCRDQSSRGRRVSVGFSDGNGLYVSNSPDDGPVVYIGLAASRRLPKAA